VGITANDENVELRVRDEHWTGFGL